MLSTPTQASTSENLKLKEGEMICDKCEGKGGASHAHPSSDLNSPNWVRCQKCQGKGKVDWVENIVGKKPEFDHGSSSSSMSSGGTFAISGTSGNPFNIPQNVLDGAAQQIANEIDKEILESLRSHSEQIDRENDIQMKTAAQIMTEMGGTIFDNGIISKFMLFFATKPKVKTKENRSTI